MGRFTPRPHQCRLAFASAESPMDPHLAGARAVRAPVTAVPRTLVRQPIQPHLLLGLLCCSRGVGRLHEQKPTIVDAEKQQHRDDYRLRFKRLQMYANVGRK